MGFSHRRHRAVVECRVDVAKDRAYFGAAPAFDTTTDASIWRFDLDLEGVATGNEVLELSFPEGYAYDAAKGTPPPPRPAVTARLFDGAQPSWTAIT